MGSVEYMGKISNMRKCMCRLCTVLALVIAACPLTGCRLALEEVKAQHPEEDRLVGIFLTEQYLEGGTPELTVNPGGEISFAENRERIEGTLVFDENGPKDIVFDGIEGYGIYDIAVWNEEQGSYTSYAVVDDIFSDGSLKVGDGSSLEATVYVGPDGPCALYFNPVYQTAESDVYMQPGSGLSWAEGAGIVSSTLSQERRVSENGQETVQSSSFAVCITYVKQIASYRLLFMDRNSSAADVMTGEELVKMWDAGQWQLRVPAEIAYLVLEQEEENGDIRRTLCNRGEESLEYLRSVGGGYIVKQQMNIIWE